MTFTFTICTREEAFDYEKVYKRVAHYAGENWGERLFSKSVVENNKATFVMRLTQGTLEAEVENGWVYIQGDKVDFVESPIVQITLRNMPYELIMEEELDASTQFPKLGDGSSLIEKITQTPLSTTTVGFINSMKGTYRIDPDTVLDILIVTNKTHVKFGYERNGNISIERIKFSRDKGVYVKIIRCFDPQWHNKLALAMVQHPRLGADSPLACIPAEILPHM